MTNRPRRTATALVLALLTATSCTTDTVDLDDYDVHCQKDSDCTAVLSGPRCSCRCDSSGINRLSLTRYQKDYQALECPGCGLAADCGPCEPVEAICQVGRCQVRKGLADGGTSDTKAVDGTWDAPSGSSQ